MKSGNGTIRRPAVEPKRSSSVTSNGSVRKSSGSEEGAKVLANGSRTRRSAVSQLRSMTGPILKNGRMTSKSFDGGRSSYDAGPLPVMKPFTNGFEELRTGRKTFAPKVAVSTEPVSPEPVSPAPEKASAEVKQGAEAVATEEATTTAEPTTPGEPTTPTESAATVESTTPAESATPAEDPTDTVSGVLYDMLQKEVIALRKSSQEKDQSLKDKDNAIEVCYFTMQRWCVIHLD